MSNRLSVVLAHGFWGGAAHRARVIVERRTAARMNPQRTIEPDASHASLASQPGAIADLIDEAAASLT